MRDLGTCRGCLGPSCSFPSCSPIFLKQLLGARAKLELEVKDVSERVTADGDEQARLADELKTLEASIADREQELTSEAGPAYDRARAR